MGQREEACDVLVEIWSDVVCPWCAIGKRRFEAALEGFPQRDRVAVRWRSFELDPGAPPQHKGDYAGRLAAKYAIAVEEARTMIDRMTRTGAGEGLAFDFARAQPGNTFDAHRLLQLAAEHGVQDALAERLMRGYHCEGEAIGLTETLQRLAVDAGLPPSEVAAVLASDRYAAAVRDDEREAVALGIRAVPFFVVARRYGVAGAQPAEVLAEALQRAWGDDLPLTGRTAGAGG